MSQPTDPAAHRARPSHKVARYRRYASFVALALATGSLLASATWAFEDGNDADEASVPNDLRSVLPKGLPRNLRVEAFNVLGKNWETWSKQTIDLLAKMHEKNRELDASGQRKVLDRLHVKLDTLGKSIDDDQYNVIHRDLLTLKRRLQRRVDLMEAALDVLQQPDSELTGTASRFHDRLQASIAGADEYLRGTSTASAWHDYLELDKLTEALSSADDQAAAKLCDAVADRLNTVEMDDAAHREFVAREPLQHLAVDVEVYTMLAEFGATPKTRRELLIDQLTALFEGVEQHETDNLQDAANAMRRANTIINVLSPTAGSRLYQAMQPAYLDHNLHVYATEDLLKEFAAQHRTKNGDINDCVFGAHVTGCQVTNIDTTVDVKPAPQGGVIMTFKATGITRTSTTGRKHPAVIQSAGQHYFWVTKDIHFDGYTFTPMGAKADIDTNNYLVGASTSFDCIPILGRIARNMAIQKVNEMKPRGEQLAAKKMADNLLPEVNKEVDTQVADVNNQMKAALDPLRPFGLYPESINARSSESYLAISARTLPARHVGGSQPSFIPQPTQGVAIQIHESMLNSMLDQLDVAGRTLSEDELVTHLEARLSRVLGRKITFPQATTPTPRTTEPADGGKAGDGDTLAIDSDSNERTRQVADFAAAHQPTTLQPASFLRTALADEKKADDKPKPEDKSTFIFERQDPLRIRIEDGSFTLVFRMGVRQEGKDEIPPQQVTVPITYTLEGGTIILEAGTAGATPIKPLRGFRERTLQLGRAGQIRRIMEAKLPRREIDTSMEVKAAEDRVLPLAVNRMESGDGWLTVWIQ